MRPQGGPRAAAGTPQSPCKASTVCGHQAKAEAVLGLPAAPQDESAPGRGRPRCPGGMHPAETPALRPAPHPHGHSSDLLQAVRNVPRPRRTPGVPPGLVSLADPLAVGETDEPGPGAEGSRRMGRERAWRRGAAGEGAGSSRGQGGRFEREGCEGPAGDQGGACHGKGTPRPVFGREDGAGREGQQRPRGRPSCEPAAPGPRAGRLGRGRHPLQHRPRPENTDV